MKWYSREAVGDAADDAADHLERTERALRAERKRNKIAREALDHLALPDMVYGADTRGFSRAALAKMKAVK